MAIRLGIVSLNGCSYELAYDLLSQSTANNSSLVRLYGILHVTNNYVSWTRGYASVYTSGLIPIGTYYSKGDYTIITRDFTFKHDSSGDFNAYIEASLSTTFTSGNTGGILTLPKIIRQATITSANNITDEENPTFTFENPGGFDLIAELEINPNNDHLLSRTIENTRNYIFELTDEERSLIRSYLPSSNFGTLRYLLYSNNRKFVSYIDKVYTIVNANPIFNNFEFEDINPTTLALTGDKSININGYSNVKATISSSNKATAKKEAKMIQYKFNIGEKSSYKNYSDDDEITITINNAPSGTYNLYAIDSRNNSTLVTKLASKEIDYIPISINKQRSSLLRDNNQVGENAILTLNGTIWNGDFGQIVNNIKSVTYRFKKTNSNEWIDGTTKIVPIITGNSFSFVGKIASNNDDTTWDLDSSYNLELTISDELSSTTMKGTDFVLNSAKPTIAYAKNGVGIMSAYDDLLGGSLQVYGDLYIADINKENVVNVRDLSKNIYSTEEQIIGTWTDGKTLYRKTYKFETSSGNVTYWTEFAKVPEDIETTINMYGTITDSDGNVHPINYYEADTKYIFIMVYYGTSLSYQMAGYGLSIVNFTVEYTKTTDL